MSSNPAPNPLRYRIKPYLAGLPRHERLRFKRIIRAYTGISDSSYSRYLNLRRHDTGDIPARVLRAFAGLMNRTMEELFTETEKAE